MNGRHWAGLITVGVLLVFGFIFYSQLFYTVDASEIAVFQAPLAGTLSVKATPGTWFRFGSYVTSYKKRDLFSFDCKPNDENRSIQVRFNDGGHAQICGNLSWEMPTKDSDVILLHTYFHGQDNVDRQLVKNAIISALYQTSPLMSSTESYAARRTDFLQLFADQLENGVYKTESVQTKQPDPITGEPKTVTVTNIVRDKEGQFVRAESSQMKQFGLNILPPTITNIVYDPEVEKQIQQQRDNIMAIQTAQAQAKKAEQSAITAAKNGEAQAMSAKWDQEVVKAQQVTLAEQQKAVAEIAASREASVQVTNAKRDLDVQTLAAQTAEQYRIEQVKRGQGDAERRQLVMAADGALQAKLDTWLKSQEMWSGAFANYRGNVVPQFITGATGGASAANDNGLTTFMNVMGMKAAKDLALDLSVQPALPPRK